MKEHTAMSCIPKITIQSNLVAQAARFHFKMCGLHDKCELEKLLNPRGQE